jgi:hypothetical protein
MKTMTKMTIRNATKTQLAEFVADIKQDIPNYGLTYDQLRAKAKECERMSKRWFGETITFEEWASN